MTGVDGWIRAASVLFVLTGVGFGIPAVIGIQSLAAGRGVPLVMGYPSLGGGVFERFGVRSTVPLVATFLIVCMLETVAGAALWMGLRWGAVLGVVLLVPGLVFWVGFSLPFPPVFAMARTVILVVRWTRLR